MRTPQPHCGISNPVISWDLTARPSCSVWEPTSHRALGVLLVERLLPGHVPHQVRAIRALLLGLGWFGLQGVPPGHQRFLETNDGSNTIVNHGDSPRNWYINLLNGGRGTPARKNTLKWSFDSRGDRLRSRRCPASMVFCPGPSRLATRQ